MLNFWKPYFLFLQKIYPFHLIISFYQVAKEKPTSEDSTESDISAQVISI